MSAHTRLVPAVRRADTRAKTEPRRQAEPQRLDSTSPYPRSFEARNEGRESVPYLELEIATEKQDRIAARAAKPTRVVKTVSRKIGVGTGPETALDQPALKAVAACKAVDPEGPTELAPPDDDDHPTLSLVKQSADKLEPSVVDDELELSTARVVKMIEALTPKQSTRAETQINGPAPRPSMLEWLGVVLTQPEVGAALMIGTWLRPEFRVTSPITHVFPRGDGVLVQTTTKSRYFVGPSGDTYLVRVVPQGTST
jgi:hypothetical protein